MKNIFIIIFGLFFLSFFFLFPSYASVGVGVGTGKIEVDEVLRPGMGYKLPSITVYNTGDEPSEFFLSIDSSTKEGRLASDLGWYTFTPDTFYLEPEGYQVVEIDLNIPMFGAEPGEYFAYLIAQPKKTLSDGSASVGVAAATKLYFSVEAANIFEALYYKFLTFYNSNKIFTIAISILFILLLLWLFLRKKIKIEIVRKNDKN